jgi:hypothetical protein
VAASVTAAEQAPAKPGRRALVADMRTRIDRRHMRTGDAFRGGVVLHEVQSREGTRADALAIDFRNGHPSLIGYEIKVDRGDWLNELDRPEKANAWAQYCTEWYVAAPAGVVRTDVDELPDGWGLVTPTAKVRLVTTRQARVRPVEQCALPLPVVIELAKKLDTQRVHEVVAAQEAVRQRIAELQGQVREQQFNADSADAEVLRSLLGRLGTTVDEVGRWTLNREGSPQEQALGAALKGLPEVLALRGRAQQDLERVRKQLQRALAELDGNDEREPW